MCGFPDGNPGLRSDPLRHAPFSNAVGLCQVPEALSYAASLQEPKHPFWGQFAGLRLDFSNSGSGIERSWNFVVLTGKSREALGEIMAQAMKRQNPELPDSGMEIERTKPLRAPVLIAVGVDKPSDPRVLAIENICAVAAAVENLLLAAHAEGLGAHWRTGPAALDPEVKKFL